MKGTYEGIGAIYSPSTRGGWGGQLGEQPCVFIYCVREMLLRVLSDGCGGWVGSSLSWGEGGWTNGAEFIEFYLSVC